MADDSDRERRFWLVKSDPESFSFDDLWKARGKRTGWDGVRSYPARNFMRDGMRVGDGILFYHSNIQPPGVAGLARVASPAHPDPTQFNAAEEHFDPKSTRVAPIWVAVDIQAVEKLPRFLTLDQLKSEPRLGTMLVLQRGQRLSVMPVTSTEWQVVLSLAGHGPGEFGSPGGAPVGPLRRSRKRGSNPNCEAT